MTWPGLTQDVEDYVKSCHECQLCKNPRKNYGYIPFKEVKQTPWDTVCVNLIGPYSMTTKTERELHLQAMTMADPATGWFKTVEYVDRKAATIADLVEQT